MSFVIFFLTLYSVTPKPQYQFNLKVQQFGEALINGESRKIYRLFVPSFRQEIDYSRFDSAFKAWQAGRRIMRVRNKAIDTRGLGGHASTYVFFQGASDYDYLYHNWIYTDSGWELAWISQILDQSFQYGTKDTVELRIIVKRALEFFISPEGLKHIKLGKIRLDTIAVVKPGYINDSFEVLAGRQVVWRAKEDKFLTRMPVFCEFGVVKNWGDVALVAIDLKPSSYYFGRKIIKRPRGMEVYLKKDKGNWPVHSVGKCW